MDAAYNKKNLAIMVIVLGRFDLYFNTVSYRSWRMVLQNLIFVLIKFIVSEFDLFRFSLSFSAIFWMVFLEPGAALSAHAKISGTKLLCSHPELFVGILMF